MPTEIHIGTVADEQGAIAILSIFTTEGLLDIALDQQAAASIVKAIGSIRPQAAIAKDQDITQTW